MSDQTVTIRDDSSGAEASISPHRGSNCYSFRVPIDGDIVDVFWAHPEFLSGTQRPSGSGIPILFPFPGRIKGTVLRWDNQEYPLAAGDAFGNAIHGFVHTRQWRVIERKEDAVTTEFHAATDDPKLLDQWPADFRIRCEFCVRGTSLTTKFRIDNPDHRPLPLGLGTHPYFGLPLLPNGDANDCIVSVPVTREWELDSMITTGKHDLVGNADEFESGMRFGDAKFDNVFSGLKMTDGHYAATIGDRQRQMRMSYSADFTACVLFTPPHREAICIEPYTCIPDPFRLHHDGLEVGLKILPPGGVFEPWIEYAIV